MATESRTEYLVDLSPKQIEHAIKWSNKHTDWPIVKSFVGPPYQDENDTWTSDVRYFGDIHAGPNQLYPAGITEEFFKHNGINLIESLTENIPIDLMDALLSFKRPPQPLFPKGLVVRSTFEPELPGRIRAYNRDANVYFPWEPHFSHQLYEIYHVDEDGRKTTKLPAGSLCEKHIIVDDRDNDLQSVKMSSLISTDKFQARYQKMRADVLSAERDRLLDENEELRDVIAGSVSGLFGKLSIKIQSALRSKKSALKQFRLYTQISSIIAEEYLEPKLQEKFGLHLTMNTCNTKWTCLLSETAAKQLFVESRLTWTNPRRTLTFGVEHPVVLSYSHAPSRQTLVVEFGAFEYNHRTKIRFVLPQV